MRSILSLICGAVLVITTGCERPEEELARKQSERAELQRNSARGVVGGIQYIKDARTGLCFAYYWGGGLNGGPALATVPCEAIPTNILTVVE